MTIMKMTAADLDAVAALEAELFTVPWSRQGFADILRRDDVLFLVAKASEKGEALLGYAGVYCAAGEGEITNVAVAPTARRRGVGRALLSALSERLAARGIFRLVLEVRVSNEPAICLYKQAGFQIVGERKRFYEKPVEDAYVMVRQPAVSYGGAERSSLQ